jgi:hypothetical protein
MVVPWLLDMAVGSIAAAGALAAAEVEPAAGAGVAGLSPFFYECGIQVPSNMLQE